MLMEELAINKKGDFMSAKLKKIINAIEKTEEVINSNQEKLKKLYHEKEEIENLEMINVLKKHKIRPSDLKNR